MEVSPHEIENNQRVSSGVCEPCSARLQPEHHAAPAPTPGPQVTPPPAEPAACRAGTARGAGATEAEVPRSSAPARSVERAGALAYLWRKAIDLAGMRVMNLARAGVAGVLVLALAIAGCNQETAETKAPEVAPPAPVAQPDPPAPPPPAAPAPIPPSTEVQVNSVDSVMLSRPPDAPNAMIIRVLGTRRPQAGRCRSSSRWPMEAAMRPSCLTSFVATSPEAVDDANTAAEQIETELGWTRFRRK